MKKYDRRYSVNEVADMVATSSDKGKYTAELIEVEDFMEFQEWRLTFFKNIAVSQERKTPERSQRYNFNLSKLNFQESYDFKIYYI